MESGRNTVTDQPPKLSGCERSPPGNRLRVHQATWAGTRPRARCPCAAEREEGTPSGPCRRPSAPERESGRSRSTKELPIQVSSCAGYGHTDLGYWGKHRTFRLSVKDISKFIPTAVPGEGAAAKACSCHTRTAAACFPPASAKRELRESLMAILLDLFA